MVDGSIIAIVRRYLHILRDVGLEPHFGVIFGSQARGNTHKWSDIDVMVISPRFDPPRNYKDKDLLWTSVLCVDKRIEPIACGVTQWEDDDGTPIFEVARREGVIVEV